MISPTFKGRDRSEKQEIRNAITGNTMSCDNNPTTNGLGNRNRFLKLSVVNDKPTPSMIKASVRLSNTSIRVYEERTIGEKYYQRESKLF
jgi:hypothetical protein